MTAGLFAGDFLDHYLEDTLTVLARMRESAPREVELPVTGRAWLFTRYDDVRAALADPRLVKDPRNTPATGYRLPVPAAQMMLANDPPDHDRLRALVAPAFGPRRVRALRPRIERIADSLLDRLPVDRPVDLGDAYAIALPTTVVCEMLGVPARDRPLWAGSMQKIMDEVSSPARKQGNDEFGGYLDELLTMRRHRPGDDLISHLIDRSDDGRLSRDEIAGVAMLLLLAAHETTPSLLGTGIEAVLRDPALRARMASADASGMRAAVEELARWVAPKPATPRRFAREDVVLGGVTIPAGAVVILSLASANHDPDRFPDPDRVDVGRNRAGHLAFGHGVHRCLGAPLALTIGEVAFRTLLSRFPGLAPATGVPADRRYSIRVTMPVRVPVVLDPR